MHKQEKGFPAFLRQIFPTGTRVQLIYMDGYGANDNGAPARGTCGTVTGVDDMANILMDWDDGSSLSLDMKDDIFKIV